MLHKHGRRRMAVGAQRSQRLGIAGEQVWEGVIPATTFLKDFNLNAETRLSGKVAVVGDGSTALDAARSALRAGAEQVTILYRRTRLEMLALVEEVRAALVQLLGAGGKLTAVRCQRMRLAEPDAQGRSWSRRDQRTSSRARWKEKKGDVVAFFSFSIIPQFRSA